MNFYHISVNLINFIVVMTFCCDAHESLEVWRFTYLNNWIELSHIPQFLGCHLLNKVSGVPVILLYSLPDLDQNFYIVWCRVLKIKVIMLRNHLLQVKIRFSLVIYIILFETPFFICAHIVISFIFTKKKLRDETT